MCSLVSADRCRAGEGVRTPDAITPVSQARLGEGTNFPETSESGGSHMSRLERSEGHGRHHPNLCKAQTDGLPSPLARESNEAPADLSVADRTEEKPADLRPCRSPLGVASAAHSLKLSAKSKSRGPGHLERLLSESSTVKGVGSSIPRGRRARLPG